MRPLAGPLVLTMFMMRICFHNGIDTLADDITISKHHLLAATAIAITMTNHPNSIFRRCCCYSYLCISAFSLLSRRVWPKLACGRAAHIALARIPAMAAPPKNADACAPAEMPQADGKRCVCACVAGAVRKPSMSMACSKQWRDDLLVEIRRWVASNPSKHPRAACARGVPKEEARLAQKIKDLRRRSCNGLAMTSAERSGWDSVAAWVLSVKASTTKGVAYANGVHGRAINWLEHHSYLPSSKKKCSTGANALIKAIAKVRQLWSELPIDVKEKFEELPGWRRGIPWQQVPNKMMPCQRARAPRQHTATRHAIRWLDRATELFGDVTDMGDAHPDRANITANAPLDYTIYLPHALPGGLTTSFSDMHESLMAMAVNARMGSCKKHKLAAAAGTHHPNSRVCPSQYAGCFKDLMLGHACNAAVRDAATSAAASPHTCDARIPVPRVACALEPNAVGTAPGTQHRRAVADCDSATPPGAGDVATSDSDEQPVPSLSTIREQPNTAQRPTIAAIDGGCCSQVVARRRFVRPRFVFRELHRGPMDVL